MHSTISYKGLPSREAADTAALKDIQEYLSEEGWKYLVSLGEQVSQGEASIVGLNYSMGFAGIQGYPFHAFCRRYCLAAYRDWMHGGDDPVQTDEQGFTLEVVQ